MNARSIQDKSFVLLLAASFLISMPVSADEQVQPQPSSQGQDSQIEQNAGSGAATTGSDNQTVETNIDQDRNAANQEKKVEVHAPAVEHKATASATVAAPANQKPVKLYGRIEELCASTGARLPLKMQAMTPIRDTSLDAKQKTLAGKTTLQAYPMDYRGSWSGELTVFSANFDKTYFARDPEEARKEQQMMRPGTKGQYTVTFYQGSNNKIEMQPSQVVFQTTESMASQMQLMARTSPGLSAFMGGANNPMMANMQVPVMFSLHLGTPITQGEIGVTGNQMSSELMKNTLRELKAGVLENQIVTKDRSRNPQTGKVQDGYSESVLRFTRLNKDQLYLQTAYVYYRADGQFQAKYVLYGTLNRSNGATAYPPNPYGAAGNPFGALMKGGGGANPFGGMGGAGNLQQQMQQMQKMIQQMGGQ